MIEYKLLSLTYKVLSTSQPSYLNNLISVQPLAVPAPLRLSPFLAHQPSPHWKSQIAHSDMHHHVSGINSLIHFVSLASHVSTHFLIHLSAHLYYHYHSQHPSLLHSFTPDLKPTFSINPSHLRLLLPTGLPSWQRDWTGPTMLIGLFLVSHFNFLFVPCGRLSWLPVSFLLHVKYTLSYRIICWMLCILLWEVVVLNVGSIAVRSFVAERWVYCCEKLWCWMLGLLLWEVVVLNVGSIALRSFVAERWVYCCEKLWCIDV